MAKHPRPLNRRERRRENWFIWTMAAIVAVLVALAIYGSVTGAWQAIPAH